MHNVHENQLIGQLCYVFHDRLEKHIIVRLINHDQYMVTKVFFCKGSLDYVTHGGVDSHKTIRMSCKGIMPVYVSFFDVV